MFCNDYKRFSCHDIRDCLCTCLGFWDVKDKIEIFLSRGDSKKRVYELSVTSYTAETRNVENGGIVSVIS